MAEALRLNRAGAAHALVLEGVSRTFGALVALDKVDLTVGAGERRGILGANGAGKTTLFNAITGDFPSTAGRIRFFGEDVTTLPRHITFVIIEHDLDVVLRVAERITVMHNGAVYKHGTPEEIQSDPDVQRIYLGGKHG